MSAQTSDSMGGGGDDGHLAPQLDSEKAMSTKTKPADVEVDFSHLGKINAGGPAELVIDDRTAAASWFASKRARRVVKAMAKGIMATGEPGHFLVRDKASNAGSFALTVNAGSELLTYLIETRGVRRRFAIMGTVKETFDTVAELIDYYAEEKRVSLEHKLILPGVYLAVVRDKAEEEAAAAGEPEEAYLNVSGAAQAPGLPQWLQVDPRTKAAIRGSMRARVKTKGGLAVPTDEYLETVATTADAAPPSKAVVIRASVRRKSAAVTEVVVNVQTDGFNGTYEMATENDAEGDEAMYDFDHTDKAYDMMTTDEDREGPTYCLATGVTGDPGRTYDMAAANEGNPYDMAAANEGNPYDMAAANEGNPTYDLAADGAASKIYDDIAIIAQDSLIAPDDDVVYRTASAPEDTDVAAADDGRSPSGKKKEKKKNKVVSLFKKSPKPSRSKTAGTPMSRTVSGTTPPATPTGPSPSRSPSLLSPK